VKSGTYAEEGIGRINPPALNIEKPERGGGGYKKKEEEPIYN